MGNSSIRQDSIPGSDNERREKIRLKNERKHQRQRERRALELHDRCCGFLMSRKLESLAQQLVAMGFPSERATLALMLNDGKLEQSVSWLFEASETHTKSTTNCEIKGNLKIDVSEELAQISDMEARYNCSKQEVERVVVACEGDLQKAENALKSQKQESSVSRPKPEEDYAQTNGLIRSQGSPSASVFSMKQREIEATFNHSNVGSSTSMFPDPQTMNLQSLHLNHQMAVEDKRWLVRRSSPSAMFTMVPTGQLLSPSVKMEVHLGNEERMVQEEIDREAIVMMQQHPQFINVNQDSISSVIALPSGTVGLYENCFPTAENIRSNGKLLQNHHISCVANGNLEQFYQAHYQEHPHVFGNGDYSSSGVGVFRKPACASSLSPSIRLGSWSRSAPSPSATPSLRVPPSLGLFSGQSAARTFSSHLHVDWNTGGLMPELDYTSVDWTLDCASSSASKSGGLWLEISSLLRNSSGNRMSSSFMAGLQNVGMDRDASSSASLREWTSPFAGSDIFSLPRQFVTSPSL
uniref:UBA domain-containing protein n=1 Tax=Cajanus cajan TaxID=3821 RepID=A0A151SP93_CAJCA|nr:hypothetical protein KK1_002881 [Cajanus cajan]